MKQQACVCARMQVKGGWDLHATCLTSICRIQRPRSRWGAAKWGKDRQGIGLQALRYP